MRLTLLAAVFVSLVPLAAHADTIDDFVITGGSHTIAYSLPATSSYPDFNLFNFFSESAPATIDGVSGYTVSGAYYLPGLIPVTLILSVPSSVFGTSSISLVGPSFFTFTTVPANNSFPYLPYDIVPTFTPGTYLLHTTSQQPGIPTSPPVDYTLTITPQTTTPTAVPEPSSLSLLVLGAASAIATLRRTRHRTVTGLGDR